MNFLTAYYKQSDAGSVSLLLQQYRWHGRYVCFACLADAMDGRAGAYMTEQLLFWFRGLSDNELTKMVKNKNKVVAMKANLEHVIERTDEELMSSGLTREQQAVSMVGVLCVDELYIFFHRGSSTGYFLNRYFGHTMINQFSQSETHTNRKDKIASEWGRMEENIGIVLTTGSYADILSKEHVREGIRRMPLHMLGNQEKYLKEIGVEGERAGGSNMASILIMSCKELGDITNEKNVNCTRRKRRKYGKKPGINAGRLSENWNPHTSRCMSAEIRDVISRQGYEVLYLLGQGSFADVYLVKKIAFDQLYACKICQHKDMLKNEFQILKELQHPLFPRVYDYWETERSAVMCMEYLAGEVLQSKLDRRGSFSVRQIARIGLDLAEGLLSLHEGWNLIFRDIKPENIIITQRGEVKLFDFGCVCKPEEINHHAGSPGYGAPEQFEEGEVNVTADVYGLGRTLEALLRKRNHKRRRGKGRTRKQESRSLHNIIDVCTRSQAIERMPDMRSVIQVLAPLGKGGGAEGMYPSKSVHVSKRWIQRQYQRNIWESEYKRT